MVLVQQCEANRVAMTNITDTNICILNNIIFIGCITDSWRHPRSQLQKRIIVKPGNSVARGVFDFFPFAK
jgi:hypothetical protein